MSNWKRYFKNVSAAVSDNIKHKPWSDVKRILEKVHKHVYDYVQYSDTSTLLQRSHLRNGSPQNYIAWTTLN